MERRTFIGAAVAGGLVAVTGINLPESRFFERESRPEEFYTNKIGFRLNDRIYMVDVTQDEFKRLWDKNGEVPYLELQGPAPWILDARVCSPWRVYEGRKEGPGNDVTLYPQHIVTDEFVIRLIEQYA